MFTWQESCRLQNIDPANPSTIPRLFAIEKNLVEGVSVGSALWLAYQQAMAQDYSTWHASVYHNDVVGGDGISTTESYVGITSDGDCSCGGDSGGCGD